MAVLSYHSTGLGFKYSPFSTMEKVKHFPPEVFYSGKEFSADGVESSETGVVFGSVFIQHRRS